MLPIAHIITNYYVAFDKVEGNCNKNNNRLNGIIKSWLNATLIQSAEVI